MLDEIMEVKSYLMNPESDTPRIKKGNLNDKKEIRLNGIGDVLTLVASHYLYDFLKIKELNISSCDQAIAIMRAWCGFDKDLSEEELVVIKSENEEWFQQYGDAEGWLKKYFKKNFSDFPSEWSTYSKKWGVQFKNELAYTSEAITYETILAQVAERGPLKRRYLLVKKEYSDAISHEILTGDNKKPDERKQRNILKLIAAYKLLQLFHPGQEYVVLQSERVLSWMGLTGTGKADRWCLDVTWKGEALFTRESHSDYKKFRVNPRFIKEKDIQLIEHLPEACLDDYHIYQDMGHGAKNGLEIIRNI